jgi:hypothetical protein
MRKMKMNKKLLLSTVALVSVLPMLDSDVKAMMGASTLALDYDSQVKQELQRQTGALRGDEMPAKISALLKRCAPLCGNSCRNFAEELHNQLSPEEKRANVLLMKAILNGGVLKGSEETGGIRLCCMFRAYPTLFRFYELSPTTSTTGLHDQITAAANKWKTYCVFSKLSLYEGAKWHLTEAASGNDLSVEKVRKVSLPSYSGGDDGTLLRLSKEECVEYIRRFIRRQAGNGLDAATDIARRAVDADKSSAGLSIERACRGSWY